MEWQTIDNAPEEKEILGFFAYPDTNTEGVTYPNKFPFVCMLVPSDGEYDTHWVVYDAYGDIDQDDGPAPTHWMPLPEQPK